MIRIEKQGTLLPLPPLSKNPQSTCHTDAVHCLAQPSYCLAIAQLVFNLPCVLPYLIPCNIQHTILYQADMLDCCHVIYSVLYSLYHAEQPDCSPEIHSILHILYLYPTCLLVYYIIPPYYLIYIACYLVPCLLYHTDILDNRLLYPTYLLALAP